MAPIYQGPWEAMRASAPSNQCKSLAAGRRRQLRLCLADWQRSLSLAKKEVKKLSERREERTGRELAAA